MPRVIHFEMAATDPAKLSKFYSDIFGWKITKWDGPVDYWMIETGDKSLPGINGGLVKRKGEKPAVGTQVNSFFCTIDVPSFDEYEKKILAAGGTVAVPKTPIPGMGYYAYYLDIDNNIFGIMQEDKSAKM